MTGKLFFELITPEGIKFGSECDAVNLFARDNKKGAGGGSVGIRRGHARAIIALDDGKTVNVVLDGKTVFSAAVAGGFADVSDNKVTVITSGVPDKQ